MTRFLWCNRMLVLIFIVGSMLFLQQPEGRAAESNGRPFEQSRHIHTQDAPTDVHQHRGPPYSLFMHQAAGYFMLAIAILMAMDRATRFRQRLLQYATGVMWALFGLFIFVRADPDGWPMGSGFWESWTMPTHAEWLQHKLLSLIPLLLALYAFRARPTMGQDNRESYVAAGLVIIGAVGLLNHQHLDHPALDAVNIQHRFFAGTSLLIAFSLLQEARGRWMGNNKRLIFPMLLILFSLQLVSYTE